MHILFLHQYFCPPGGSGNNRSFELAKEWIHSGHTVTMATTHAWFSEEWKKKLTPGKKTELNIEGIKTLVYPVDYSHHMPFRERIRAFTKFFKYLLGDVSSFKGADIVYASSTPLTVGQAGVRISKKLNIPLVFETVDVWPDVPIEMGIITNPLLKFYLRKVAKSIYNKSNAIVVLSEGMRDQVISSGADPTKVYVFHNGTNPSAFVPTWAVKPAEEKVIAIYAGTVGIANDLSQLVEAAEIIEKKGFTKIKFEVLGDGNDLERVKEIAKQKNISNLIFRGIVPKEEASKIIANADIGIVCFANFKTLEANSANKFYDYLASGLPVVINYEGWQAEYLRVFNCGLSSKQGNNNQFAENLICLANDSELRRKLGENGRKLVLEKFDRKKIAEGILGMMKSITN